MKRTLLVLIFCAICLPCLAANTYIPPLNSSQVDNLKLSYSTGSYIGWPETMEAIIWQESSIGTFKVGDDGISLGLAHVQVGTAQKVLKKYPWLQKPRTRYELARKLLRNNSFNMMVASLYFNSCWDQFHNWKRALVCYNAGPYTASRLTSKQIDKYPYVLAIEHRIREVRVANARYSITKMELAFEEKDSVITYKQAAELESSSNAKVPALVVDVNQTLFQTRQAELPKSLDAYTDSSRSYLEIPGPQKPNFLRFLAPIDRPYVYRGVTWNNVVWYND